MKFYAKFKYKDGIETFGNSCNSLEFIGNGKLANFMYDKSLGEIENDRITIKVVPVSQIEYIENIEYNQDIYDMIREDFD